MFEACRSVARIIRSVIRVSRGAGTRVSAGARKPMKSSAGSSRRQHALADDANPVTWILDPDRPRDTRTGEAVATHRVVVGAQADGEGDRKLSDVDAVRFVVVAQTTHQAREIGVIDRSAHRLAGGS